MSPSRKSEAPQVELQRQLSWASLKVVARLPLEVYELQPHPHDPPDQDTAALDPAAVKPSTTNGDRSVVRTSPTTLTSDFSEPLRLSSELHGPGEVAEPKPPSLSTADRAEVAACASHVAGGLHHNGDSLCWRIETAAWVSLMCPVGVIVAEAAESSDLPAVAVAGEGRFGRSAHENRPVRTPPVHIFENSATICQQMQRKKAFQDVAETIYNWLKISHI